MKKFALFTIIIVLLGFTYNTSERKISGTVTDEFGVPVVAATVKVKNTTVSTLTDKKGKYELELTKDAKYLVVSALGMKTKDVQITRNPVINVVLELDVPESKDEEVADELKELRMEQLMSLEVKSVSSQRKRMGRKKAKMSMAMIPLSYEQQPDNHNTESYDKISENTFKDALTNPLSTFSADVDKAAYANVRRFLNQNSLPPADAVRIEEMINYFDYNYPLPKDEHPFSANMEMGLCYWNKEHYLLQIGIKGKEIYEQELVPSNLVFLIDVSGSMSASNKLPLLKSAFKILMDKLRPHDKVAIVVYAGAAGEVLPSTSCRNKAAIIKAFDKLQSGGSTAGGAGIQLAYKIAKDNFIKDGNNRVILATDGDFNIGQSSDGDLVRMIEEKREDDVFLTVLGFGMGNYKDAKMETLSNAGNGNYAYIDNILEAKKVLGKEIWGTLYTIAKDVKIQVEFNPAKVKAYRLIGYENRMLNKEDFDDDKKDAGEIGAGHTVTAIYEIIPAGSNEKVNKVGNLEYQNTKIVKSDEILTLKLRYKAPDGDKSKLIVKKVKEGDIKKTQMSSNFEFASAVAEFGMLLRKSEFKGESSYKHTLALAKKAKGADKEGYRSEFIRLVKIAEALSDN